MEYDCLSCAACCRVFGVVEVSPQDRIPLPLIMDTELGYKTMKVKPYTFECVCLDGNKCSIYENRPDVCRKFEVGGFLCKLARWKMGLGPFPDVEKKSCVG